MKRIMIEVLFFDNKGGKTETNVMINDDSYDGAMIEYYKDKRILCDMLSFVINFITLIMKRHVPVIDYEIIRNSLFQHYLGISRSKQFDGFYTRIKEIQESEEQK